MPIDPNIAMGVRPVEQPNMLAQMGQMMALRSAQQEYEGQNALREAFASGGSLNDPAFVQRLRAANPKMALDIEAKHLAGQKTQSELLGAAYKNSREALTMVNSPESLRAYTVSQFSDPVMGPALKARGLTPEIALANLDKEISTSGFNTVLKKSAMGLDSFFKDETSRRNTDVSSGASYQQAETARQRLKMDQEGTWSNVIVGRRVLQQNSRTGEIREAQDPTPDVGGTVTVGPITNLPDTSTGGGVVTGGGGTPAAPNTLAAPSVNALRNPPVVATAPVSRARQPVTNPLMVEEKPVWNEKAGVYMYPPTAENPQGKVVDTPEVKRIVQTRAANETLKIAGFNPKTGSDEVSELIKKSTSGLGENWANKAWSAISGTGSTGAEAIAKLETRANEMTLGLAPNGSLGAGFSNEDRDFMLKKLGDVANPNAPMNVRLAAWEDVMERAARNAGVPYPKSAKSTGDITIDPALAEALKRYPVKK
jgi:hypothetical protein